MELRDVEESAYQKQYAKEKGKREAKENVRAERKGQLRAMPTFDRVVETAADATQKVIDTGERLHEAKNKILHTTVKPIQKVTSKVPQAGRKQILTPAQKRALGKQIEKAGKNISPKQKRGSPFAVEKKTLAVTHHTLALTKPSPSSITGKSSSGNPFGGKPRGNPFGVSRGSMLGILDVLVILSKLKRGYGGSKHENPSFEKRETYLRSCKRGCRNFGCSQHP